MSFFRQNLCRLPRGSYVYKSHRIHNAVLAERERCAKIAEHAFDHLSPLAIYESYNADGKRVTRLNPEASSRAIAAKIRIYE
jgi:hypothetical protein